MSTLKRKTSLLLEPPGGIDPDWNALALVFALGHSLDVFEITNGPGKQLGFQTLR